MWRLHLSLGAERPKCGDMGKNGLSLHHLNPPENESTNDASVSTPQAFTSSKYPNLRILCEGLDVSQCYIIFVSLLDLSMTMAS